MTDKARRRPDGIGWNTPHGARGFDLRGNRWMRFDPRLAWRYEQERAEYVEHLKAFDRLLGRAVDICKAAEAQGRRPFYVDAEGHKATELTSEERQEFVSLMQRAHRIHDQHLS